MKYFIAPNNVLDFQGIVYQVGQEIDLTLEEKDKLAHCLDIQKMPIDVEFEEVDPLPKVEKKTKKGDE